ncbi:MAG: 30S ribosome-binding factor RbfA [Desulfitobacteriaceae bacterium]|nr:30S ribosome-binding factor RbfA [Desulfitobacteriaceae bacterium]MDD4345587.1 30S ribosome-binding factor RbfA [Desulfitobacteriaceae bacterium]MDD4401528.1 30S ribosome-binding factor RbfA [Desulfitobacteriaceae bacterium]
MTKHRVSRLAETLKAEISQMIRQELKDPRIGFVTVTTVEVTEDLGHAKVFISVLGDEVQRKQSLDGLNSAAGFVRREIGYRVRLRVTPEIVFKYDPSIEHGAQIAKLLKGVEPSKTMGGDDNSDE